MKKTVTFKLTITGPDGIPHESVESIDIDDIKENPNRVEEYNCIRHCLSEFKFTDEHILKMYNHFKVPIKDEDFSFLIQEIFDVIFCGKDDSVLLELERTKRQRYANLTSEEYNRHPKKLYWSCLDLYTRWIRTNQNLKQECLLFTLDMVKHFTGKYDDSDLIYIDKFIKDNAVEWTPTYKASDYVIKSILSGKQK